MFWLEFALLNCRINWILFHKNHKHYGEITFDVKYRISMLAGVFVPPVYASAFLIGYSKCSSRTRKRLEGELRSRTEVDINVAVL